MPRWPAIFRKSLKAANPHQIENTPQKSSAAYFLWKNYSVVQGGDKTKRHCQRGGESGVNAQIFSSTGCSGSSSWYDRWICAFSPFSKGRKAVLAQKSGWPDTNPGSKGFSSWKAWHRTEEAKLSPSGPGWVYSRAIHSKKAPRFSCHGRQNSSLTGSCAKAPIWYAPPRRKCILVIFTVRLPNDCDKVKKNSHLYGRGLP